jgi:hypothetical protein
MRAVVMIIRGVRGKKPLQMARVQSDDVVEQIAAAAPHPTLGHSILPRTPNRGLHARDLQGAKRSGLSLPKNSIRRFSTQCNIVTFYSPGQRGRATSVSPFLNIADLKGIRDG